MKKNRYVAKCAYDTSKYGGNGHMVPNTKICYKQKGDILEDRFTDQAKKELKKFPRKGQVGAYGTNAGP